MKYDLQSHLDKVYATFPEAKHQPVIGITTNFSDIDATLRDAYYKQVAAAGGTPVLIPPVADKDVLVNTLAHLTVCSSRAGETSIRSGQVRSRLPDCTTSTPSATSPNSC